MDTRRDWQGNAPPMTSDNQHEARRFLYEPACVICGKSSWRLELISPGMDPLEFDAWPGDDQEAYAEYHDPAKWRLMYAGVGGYNGLGDDTRVDEAERYIRLLSSPVTFDNVAATGFYGNLGWCKECNVPYCNEHWGNLSESGWCPNGHFQSFDPFYR